MTDSSQRQRQKIGLIGDGAQASFSETQAAREQGLRLSREIIRGSANSIRATHRGEFAEARTMLDEVRQLAQQMKRALENHLSIYYAGFAEDAEKEYAEACATLAFAEGSELVGPEDLGIGPAPYLNGLAEAVGEMRRFVLDSLRRDDFSRCEELLELMDDVYTILVSMDFPDAITRGLRRNTDMVRGVLERTRGDLTVALRQRRLEQRLAAFQEMIDSPKGREA